MMTFGLNYGEEGVITALSSSFVILTYFLLNYCTVFVPYGWLEGFENDPEMISTDFKHRLHPAMSRCTLNIFVRYTGTLPDVAYV